MTMPRWDSHLIELVRERNDIVDVISQYVPLKRAGSNYKALSPFKKEKTPSFYVTPSKQIWYCFSTGQGGDVFKFLQVYLGLDFPSAVRMLAERAGVELHENETDQQHSDPGGTEIKKQLYALHEKLTAHWHRLLLRSLDAAHAREYLAARGVNIDTAREFRLGYAPAGWDHTIKWAASEGYDELLLKAAGLIVQRENRSDSPGYDRFRNRIIIPITTESGQVAGFSGRTLEKGDTREAKYINSPETPIFEKSRILFGLEMHRRDILALRQALVVEGPFDLIACHAAGIRNVVAPQGTALTEQQVRTIRRYADEVVLCYDTDEAGRRATTRAAAQCLAAGLPVRVLTLASTDQDKQDPDSFVRKHGADAMRQLLASCADFWDYHISQTAQQNPPDTERGRSVLKRAVFELAVLVSEKTTLDRIFQLLAARLVTDPRLLQNEFEDWKKKNPHAARAMLERDDQQAHIIQEPQHPQHCTSGHSPTNSQTPTESTNRLSTNPVVHPVVEDLLRHVLAEPDKIIPRLLSDVEPQMISDMPGGEILTRLLESYGTDSWEGISTYISSASPAEQTLLYRLSSKERETPPLDHILIHLRRVHLEKKVRQLELQLKNTPTSEAPAILTRLLDIKTELHKLQLPSEN